MTISCIEEIYKKYVAIARAENPGMFLEKRYTPHTMRHTTATHMLEAGIPMMAIKNFLGHSSISTTERYAELSQGTVNRHIRDWNEKWFSQQKESSVKTEKGESSLTGLSKIVVTLSEEISLKIFYMGFIPGFPRIIENLG
mgnify:CR=1 FL=1